LSAGASAEADAPRAKAAGPAQGNGSRCVVGIHVCRGNWSRDETTLLHGSYHPLTSYFEAMNIDQLVLEYATPRAGDFVAVPGKSIGLGVVNPRSPQVETPATIVERVESALNYLSPDRVFLNPDCGFATFTSRAMNTPEIASRKLASMAAAATKLRETWA
jgi:5-methyltetrahydropteroyltriglutamate--homocysteine methyltransferase